MTVGGVWRNRFARRLVFAVGFLALVDPLVVPAVRWLEHSRYESDRLFRFENSDLFGVGPVAAYLREHPRGQRPRVVFFGNSIVWGYWIHPWQTVAAQFQQMVPRSKVFNFGVNGFGSGSAFLITKAIIDSIDVVYLFHVDGPPHPTLARLIPVSIEDTRRFGLTSMDPLEQSLEELLGVWKLYRYSYRLQAALFGTSTRVYLYLNKRQIAGGVWKGLLEQPTPDGPVEPAPISGRGKQHEVQIDSRVSRDRPSEDRVRALAAQYPFLWEYARMIQAHGKVGVIVEIAGYVSAVEAVEDSDRADVNAHFYPHVLFAKLHVPPQLQTDGMHFSPIGARAVAKSLFVATGVLAHLQ
jgi:hypothetical protein